MHGLPFVHRGPTLRATATGTRGAAKGRRVRRIDDVHDDAARLQQIGFQGQGVVDIHAEPGSIDNQLAAAWIRQADVSFATGFGGN